MKRNEELVHGEDVSCSFFYLASEMGVCKLVKEMLPTLESVTYGNSFRHVLVQRWAVSLPNSGINIVSELRRREYFDENDYIGEL